MEKQNTPKIVVPYIVNHLENGKAKATFGVPKEVSSRMMDHPVLCCGGCFHLDIDNTESQDNRDQDTIFLSVVYESINAEATAEAISNRLAVRLGDPAPLQASSLLGIGSSD
jgi:hypothetical protein